MRGVYSIFVASILSLSASQSYGFDLKGMTETATKAATQAATDGGLVSGETQQLVQSLTSDLGVNPKQAMGGSAALLSMAKSQLSEEQFSAITSKVPGLSGLMGAGGGLGSSMLSKISSMEGVSNAFSSLGLSPDLITQFAPILLQFLGGKGVSPDLLSSLGGLWGTKE